MALKAKEAKTGNRDVPQAGNHLARLVGIVDLGHQPGYEYRGNQIPSAYKIEFTYELVNSLTEEGMPHWVSEDVKSNDYDKNGKMSNMMARVRAIDPENDSNNGKNLLALLGKPCMVSVVLNDNGYPVVRGQSAVAGVPMGMEVKELTNEVFSFDMDEPDMNVWATFPEFKQKKIKSALNYAETALLKEVTMEENM